MAAGTWVQTERKAHQQWANLIGKHPKAAQLLHLLVSQMDKRGALVVSQGTLAELMGCSKETVKRSVRVLKDQNWVDVVRVGSERGGTNCYVINRRVAWADKRENGRFAAFDAKVIVSGAEQPRATLEGNSEPLKLIPKSGEGQIPVGPNIPPPNQDSLFEPDLPTTGDDG